MRKIVLASNNKHKVKEIKEMLSDIELLTLNDIGFNEEIDETGTTFLENALIKAETVSNFLKNNNLDYDVLSDDSGLSCIALDGKPGVYSARYASDHDIKLNRTKLISDLKDKDKKAYFNCTLVLYHIDGKYEYTEGKTYGTIIEEEKGDTSFGYDVSDFEIECPSCERELSISFNQTDFL